MGTIMTRVSRLRHMFNFVPRAHLVVILACSLVLGAATLLPSDKTLEAEESTRVQIQLKSPGPGHEPDEVPQSSKKTPVVAEVLEAESPVTADTESAQRETGPGLGQEAAPASEPPSSAPEKVELTKNEAANDAEAEESWLEINVRSGDNLTTLFHKAGLGPNEMYPLLNNLQPRNALDRLKPGERLDFLIDDGELEKLRHVLSPLKYRLILRDGDGWVRQKHERTPETAYSFRTGTIQESLFLAGDKAGLTQKKIMELANIFGWDVDFALDIRQGDSFAVLYEELWLNGKKIGNGDIVAAEFTNRGQTFQAVRYRDSKGNADYYTPSGDSMRKAFLRSPVGIARISSRFNPNRLHPVLKYRRPHRGVDYAAPVGTPIKTSGDGKVIFAGWKGGYGKTVIVRHGGRYTTLYAHMSRIKPGMRRGKWVKQGQTIGYIGATGNVTGAHLHYEFRVNGVHRNPLTVELPKAEPLPKSEMAAFRKTSAPLLARLDRLRETQVALDESDER